MAEAIDLTPAELAIVRDTLRAYLPSGTLAWVFGFRATAAARRYSDIDLTLEGTSAFDPTVMPEPADALSQ